MRRSWLLPRDASRLGVRMTPVVWLVVAAVVVGLYLVTRPRSSDRPASAREQTKAREVVVRANEHRQYVVPGVINGQTVEFVIDTGANIVSIPGNLAFLLNLDKSKGVQSMSHTAGGNVRTYSYTLARVSVGPISLRNVEANVNPEWHSDKVLLGMSFLGRINYRSEQGILTLGQD